ncbi:uncharacterized protein LOC135502402 isoform X2 [Lineus longissimus]|uniref:uncharacterized protein LOC135502402 isoform X2 n=1 Tax=Lineus longissimus TaxID=88925 RepID=UPI002B4E7766
MAEGESSSREGNGVKFRDPKPTPAELRDSSRNTTRESRASARGSRISQGSQSGKGGVLMVRKFNMTDELKNYTHKGAFYTAIAQIVVGLLCLILGIVALVVKTAGGESCVGIWGGVIIIVAGIVGILAYKRRIARLIVTCFAMSLISLVIGGAILIMLAAFLVTDINRQKKYTEEIDFWPEGSSMAISSKKLAEEQGPKIIVDVVLMIFGIVEMVVAILQAVIAGKVLIIRGPKRTPVDAGAAGTPLTDMGDGEEDGWGEYNPAPKPKLTRTLSETEADQEFGEVDPDRIPTKRSSYRGSKEGGYKAVKRQPSAEREQSGDARASVEGAAAADFNVEIGFSAGVEVGPAEANVRY